MPPVHFCSGYFGDGVEGSSGTICLGCPWTTSILISASQVAWITGVSHLQPASNPFYVSQRIWMKDRGKLTTINKMGR
jgi:hypothetical protein